MLLAVLPDFPVASRHGKAHRPDAVLVIHPVERLRQLHTLLPLLHRVEKKVVAAARRNIRQDDPRLLEENAGAIYFLHQIERRRRDFERIRRRDAEPPGRYVAILRQVLAEAVAAGEDRHAPRCRVLPAQGAAAAGCEGGNRSLEVFLGRNHIAEATAGGDGLPPYQLRSVDAGMPVQLQPGLVARFMEIFHHPLAAFVRELQGRGHPEGGELREGAGPYSPYIRKLEQGEGLAPLLVAVYHTYAAVAFVLLRELACDLGERLGLGNAHAHRDIGPESYLPHHPAHQLHEVTALPVAVQVEELFVYRIALRALDGTPHYALHPLGHRRVEHQVSGKYGYAVPLDDVLHLEERVAAPQPQRLGFGGEGHYVAVIAGEHAYGLALEPRVKGPLDGGEEGIAVGEGNHTMQI